MIRSFIARHALGAACLLLAVALCGTPALAAQQASTPDVAAEPVTILLLGADKRPDERIDGVRSDIMAVLGHVWYSTLVAWANDRIDFDAVIAELDRAVRVLVEPHERTVPA